MNIDGLHVLVTAVGGDLRPGHRQSIVTRPRYRDRGMRYGGAGRGATFCEAFTTVPAPAILKNTSTLWKKSAARLELPRIIRGNTEEIAVLSSLGTPPEASLRDTSGLPAFVLARQI